MWWNDWIYSIVWDISEWFRSIGQTTSTWVYPFNMVSTPFFIITSLFQSCLTPIANFGDWAADVWARVQQILSFDQLVNLFSTWINYATEAWNWVQGAWWNVTGIISSWWSATSTTVLGWIDIAAQEVKQLISGVETWVAILQITWDNFWTTTFPTLANWAGVNNLIDSSLKSWFPFYDDLTNIWNEIVEFFADPPQYVYNKLDEFFERFW